MTAQDLIVAAAEEIGALGAGEPLAAADAKAGLVRLNGMIDLWQTERLMVPTVSRVTFTFVANQAAYTVGVTATPPPDVVCPTLPLFIDHAAVIWPAGVSAAIETPIALIRRDQWANESSKALTASVPTKAIYEPTVPWGTLTVWPVPTSTYDAALYIGVPLTRVADLDTDLVLLPGYEEALRYNLAVRLCPLFGKPVDQTVAALAIESKGQVKRSNYHPGHLRCDDAITGGKPWSIDTGGF